MKNFIKINVIFLTIFVIFPIKSHAKDRILPLPKPNVSEEVKKITSEKKNIYPKHKPKMKSEDKTTEAPAVDPELADNKKEEVFIYPKKKPVLVQKKVDKVATKSSILSKRDFKIAISAFQAIDKKKWKTALKLSKKARDKSLYKLINYLYLIKTSNAASFYDYTTFINNNPDYPRVNRLRYLAEHKINLKTNSPTSILKWFDNKEPLSDFGKIKLGEIYLLQDDFDKGSKLIKEGWIKAKLSKSQLRY